MRALFDALSEPNEIRLEVFGATLFRVSAPGWVFAALGMSGFAATLCLLL